MAKAISGHICEQCGKQFLTGDTNVDARRCEASHITIAKIQYGYITANPRKPVTITLTFPHGEKVIYRKEE